MKENKGFSLVELLVGITIAAIVAGSIGFFLTTSLRMYNKETVEVTLQQELQVTINQVMDYAMESETIVADFDGTYPDYLALGKFRAEEGAGATNKTTIDSQIIWKDGNKLYLKKAEIKNFCLSLDPDNPDYRKINVDKIIDLIPEEGTADDINLLAQYVTDFNVSKVSGIASAVDDEGNTIEGYENPLSLVLKIGFEKTATTKRNKRVEETVYLRNRVTNDIYVNIAPDQLDKTYSLVNDNKISIETTTVEMEKQAGIIQIPGTESGGSSQDLNILEIVPDYSYDYVQYVIGGEKGALLNSANTTYGASAGITPVTPAEFEGFLVRTAGYRQNNNSTYGLSGFYPNNGADIPAVYISGNVSMAGYYEYVGETNGGVYAIDSYTEKLDVASARGYGDSRPVIKYFVPNEPGTWEKTKYTGRYYRPRFEYVDQYNVPSDTWFYPIESVSSGGGDYNKEILTIDHDGWQESKEIYVYAGNGNGEYTVKFGYPSTTYNTGYACYAVSGDVYDSFTRDDGQYYAFTNAEWEYRTDKLSYSFGYDYLKSIEDVVMFSKYYGSEPRKSQDYGWIWHEETGGDLYTAIMNGDKVTSATIVDETIYKDYVSPSEYNRIYLKDHIRNRVINNDTFKLFTMQNVLELYTPNSMMDIRYGLWDTSQEKYCEINKNALNSWESNGHKISLNVRVPRDVTSNDIKNCDLIIIGIDGDGGFNYANTLYGYLRNSSTTASYSSSNDLSFDNALSIYKKVVAEKAAIACPYALVSAGGTKGTTNISKLFQMLYCIRNEDITKDSVYESTVNEPKIDKIKKQGEDNNYWTVEPDYQKALKDRVMIAGSGRELFTDYLKSMSDDALSKPLYDINELKHKTTDFVYIEEAGTNAGSIVVQQKNEDIEGYYIHTSSRIIPEWASDNPFVENLVQYNNNRYLLDRYWAAEEWNGKASFTWNAAYNHMYKFSYWEPQEGIYRNQLVWNQTSDLLHLSKSGATGALGLQSIRNNTNNGGVEVAADIIGTINYVGADLKEEGAYRRANQGNTAEKQFSEMPAYSMPIIELPDYRTDPTDPNSVVTKKVLYMTEEQFLRAQTEGLYFYVLIKTSKDPSNYNKCVLRYEKNEKDANGKPLTGRVDYEADNFDNDNNENNENCIKYASGVYPNGTIKQDEVYVREYRYHMPPQYFQNLAPAYNNKNNMVVARIDKTAERKYEGNDTVYIYIRDTFDLD